MNPLMSMDLMKPQLDAMPRPDTSDNKALRDACEQAEGLFASILLKEGLKPVFEETEESGSHAGGLIELAVEQMAQDMGKEGALGIGDAFYDQLAGKTVMSVPTRK